MKAIRKVVFQYLHCGCFLLVIGLAASRVLASSEEWDYVMQPGDTLISIAERHFANPHAWPVVQSRNRIADPHRIPTGARLKIPAELLRTFPVNAEVLMVNGQVNRADATGLAGELLSAGDLLQAGDGVQVAARSNLSLRFPDGTRLLVLENSRFTVTRAERFGTTGMHRVLIDLAQGRIESNVAPAPGGANAFEIKAPALRMSVRGTRFRAAADPGSGQAQSEVLSGRVRVSAARKAFVLGEGSGSYATLGKAPQPPRRLDPAPELKDLRDLYESLPLRFTWKPVPTGHGYRAQVLDGSANMVVDGALQDNAARWADIPDGQYTLRVRSIGSDLLEGLDAEHAFTLNARPEPPFARAPTNRAYGESTAFEWTQGVGVSTYHFQLARDETFTQRLADEPALGASRTIRELAPGRYFWRVASIDARGDHGPFGDVVAFEQRPEPASPQADVPEIGDDALSFRWRAGEPGQTYLMQLAKDPGFAELLLERATMEPSVAVPRPEAGEYFMRVRAIEPDGYAGPFGAPQRFVVPGNSGWWMLLLLLPIVL